jgi:hypothetical protein
MLDRPRHEEMIAQVRSAGARIRLISDGDVGGAIEVAKADAPVDIMIGIGGVPRCWGHCSNLPGRLLTLHTIVVFSTISGATPHSAAALSRWWPHEGATSRYVISYISRHFSKRLLPPDR